MNFFKNLFKDPNQRVVEGFQPRIDHINLLETTSQKLSDQELSAKTKQWQEELKGKTAEEQDKILDSILEESFSLVREASKRILKQRHYDVQLIGGMALHQGQIAEMKTGEGKTLVVSLPTYLNALTGRGVHIITVNDYLSRVGAGWMAPIYHLLSLSVSVIVHDAAFIYDPQFVDNNQFDDRLKCFRKINRKEAYNADITYGTNNEFGFDYLRDNMVSSLEDKVQRELNFAIIDEVDSILIDEARTPLIISGPSETSSDKYYQFAQLVKKLVENEDYNIDEKLRAVTLTDDGISKMENWLGVDNIYVSGGIREVHHIEQALKAQVLFKPEKDYVVKENEVIIVDEFTGRLMPGRRYSEGLHQAIEAKEGVDIQRESQTLATITFQNYFRMYRKLSGTTGTAVTEAEEFAKIYNLETLVIPTHKEILRKDLNDLIYKTEKGKFQAVIQEVKKRSQKGQPVLIGTISIEKNEELAFLMQKEGLRPQVLNAKNHEKEAQIIADAGKTGAITIATNMAGRGVDIILGGDDKEECEKVKALGGLHVIGTERHESRRIDNQLRGRSGRQGDPGSSQFYVSTEDDLMRIFGGDRMKKVMTTLQVPEDMHIENKLISRSIEQAQKKVEGNNFDIRKHLVEYDDVINKHREAIYRKRFEILESYQSVLEDNNNEEKKKQLSNIIIEMINQEIVNVVNFHTPELFSKWNLQEIFETIKTIFPVSDDLKNYILTLKADKENIDKKRDELIVKLQDKGLENYQKLKQTLLDLDIDFSRIEKDIMIRSIDILWVEHLDTINHVRRGIGLRGYGQRDPLVEYKKEAYRLFNGLNDAIQKQVVYSIFKLEDVDSFNVPNLSQRAQNFQAPLKNMSEKSAIEKGGQRNIDVLSEKLKDKDGNKVGRNDLCPCGSGKKYKKCHGK